MVAVDAAEASCLSRLIVNVSPHSTVVSRVGVILELLFGYIIAMKASRRASIRAPRRVL